MNRQPETTLTELIRHNNWANLQVLEACEQLSDAQLDTHISGAYGTIRETLIHIIRSEAGYIRLLTNNSSEPPFQREDGPSVAEIKAYAIEVGQALVETAEQTSLNHPVSHEWDGQQYDYSALLVFIQAINHGIEHRVNITTVLNQQEQNPPAVDGWSYLIAHPDRFKD